MFSVHFALGLHVLLFQVLIKVKSIFCNMTQYINTLRLGNEQWFNFFFRHTYNHKHPMAVHNHRQTRQQLNYTQLEKK